MSLAYAILTALTEEPSSGADLLKRFDKSIGYFWNCTHQQIYRELKQLEGNGYISSEISTQKSTSFIYRIEPKGSEWLNEWIETDKTQTATRDPFFLKLRALANFENLSPEPLILEKKRHHEDMLKIYQQIAQKAFKEPLNRNQTIKKMVLQAGLRREQSNIDWCNECLEMLAKFDTPK
ncbi:MAG: PadR family transcriptional regulator [Proteobacteria bacterium]|nr:PadR family transcriptional regulator [Pseudomonadota bacterium]MBS0493883.1 PadR family transcriptional regulator [Pseudomonadota bacterium]